MASKVAAIAEAVKEFLNAQDYSQTVRAVRRYAPLESYDDLKDLDVAVCATDRNRSWNAPWATRGQSGKGTTVYVIIIKRLAQETDPAAAEGNAEIDALMQLCEEIDDSFVTGPLADTGASLSAENSTITIDAAAMGQKLFFCTIALPFIYAD